jgi:hypothetical protein
MKEWKKKICNNSKNYGGIKKEQPNYAENSNNYSISTKL